MFAFRTYDFRLLVFLTKFAASNWAALRIGFPALVLFPESHRGAGVQGENVRGFKEGEGKKRRRGLRFILYIFFFHGSAC